MSLRSWHLLIGGVGLAVFVLQGQYMARVLDVAHLADAARMMYRSAHIYFLLACVANVTAGYALLPAQRLNHLQRLVSLLLLVSPALLLWSFFNESTSPALDRPVARTGLYLLFGAGVLMLAQEGYRKLTANR